MAWPSKQCGIDVLWPRAPTPERPLTTDPLEADIVFVHGTNGDHSSTSISNEYGQDNLFRIMT